MSLRYDVAIIGAGADGLAAASLLARAGRKVVVLERAAHAGGRCVTSEFAPGYYASPYADAVSAPPPAALGLLNLPAGLTQPFAPVGADIVQRRARAFARVLAEALQAPPQGLVAKLKALLPEPSRPWPGSDWADRSIAELRAHSGQGDWRAALAGRAADPELAGSALALFAAPQLRAARGGLGAIGAALEARARRLGVELRLDEEVSEILLRDGRAMGVVAGERLEARAVISTLDIKRTFLGLFRWSDLGPALLGDTGAWRMEGARARLLLALDAPPGFDRPIHVPGDAEARVQFRHGVVPRNPPMLVDPVSACDASVAPAGKAVVTLTLSGVPARLFDGPWDAQKRSLLLARVLERLQPLGLPGVVAAATIVPPDIEAALGLTGGDLDGGALAPDQMLGFRPGSALALVWRAAQEMAGQQGATALPVPGTLMAALRRAAGAELQTGMAVSEILVSNGQAFSVRLADGEVVSARAVLSSLSRNERERLAGLDRPRETSLVGEARIVFTLGEGASLPALLTSGRCVAALSPADCADAHEAARAGRLPPLPPFMVVAETPRALVVSLPLMPVAPEQGWAALKAPLAAQLLKALQRQAPGMGRALSGVTVTPPRARQRARLAQLLAPAFERAVTRVPGLYLCGEDAEPVPCVSGRAGRFAAHFTLKSR